ncbi:MAG: molybdopterin-synthase adenylyltransferase MoeB [Cyclobacteriaceae bacterium]
MHTKKIKDNGNSVGENFFSSEEFGRYDRQIRLPQFGLMSQTKLKKARVLVVGTGGLGSPLLLYLAAAGVGTLGLIDFDTVDESNLHRQVIFGQNQIGQAKVEAAKERLKEINPHIKVLIYNEKLTSSNAMEIVGDYEVVADGTDNFPTRYLVNDACVLCEKPNVYGSVFKFEGQVSVFNFKNKNGELGPNYRDLYPTPPPAGLVPNCAETGVIGVLPGIIGSMQALEVIKVIIGIGEPLSGKLFIFDALGFESRIFKVKRIPSNPLNGANPSLTHLIDYEDFCGVMPVKEVTAKQLYQMKRKDAVFQLIDVREKIEFDGGNLGGVLIPLSQMMDNYQKIDRKKKVVVHCKSGGRSSQAIRSLEEKFGFDNLYNLKGGIDEYLKLIKAEDPSHD